ncbi:hypothetical protein [uncultured Polaribacter sp.]|uniref:hypothetical protein n=1 Tax=uncultured Polaribacter sp. TaxID=174711 RepID=UPI0026326D5B|nr:hypothetical protein [uncultured Polaribacter sp.]
MKKLFKNSIQFAVGSLQYLVCSVQFAVWVVQCAVFSMQSKISKKSKKVLRKVNILQPNAYYQLPTEHCLLPTVNCLLPTVKLPTANRLLQTSKLQTAKLLIAILLTAYSQIATAQTYPVQVNPQLVPPYSLKLSDYQTTSAEKLFVNLLLTDTQELGRQVRLKMYIEGQGLNIETLDFVAGATPIFLDGGINQRLSNLDLRSYFNLNNLLGLTPQQYNQALPDGRYNFCFEVYDFLSGQLISRKSCFSVYLILNDPPILNTPNSGDLVTAQNPQNIIFNWTPRHLNATGVQYEFTIKELWDTSIDPQAAFLASPALAQTTTFATTLLYGPADTQLLEGKTYGWQVRALVSDGISETSVFRNNGYSEINHFKYEGNCDTPNFILSEAQDSQTVEITWQFSDHLRYQIQYRKKGYGAEDWFSLYAYNQQSNIQNLEAGVTYEFRVGGECTFQGGFAFSQIHEFTTPTEDEEAYYNCGIPPEIDITNQSPLQNIGAGETFKANDFPVVIGEVTGSSGSFSGWGYITIPFLEKLKTYVDLVNEASEGSVNIGKYTRIKVTFNNIGINTDYQLISGFVETEYDPDWKSIIDLDQAYDNVTDTLFGDDGKFDEVQTDIIIDEIRVDDNGDVIVTNAEGNSLILNITPPAIVTDGSEPQKKWEVDKDGNVTPLGEEAEGGAPTSNNTNGASNNGNVNSITAKDVSILFSNEGFYSSDQLRQSITDTKFRKKYETIAIANEGNYNVLYKAISDIKDHTEDFLTAKATFSNGKTSDDIVFKTKQGVNIPATWNGNTATIPLKKRLKFAKEEILATVKPVDSTAKYNIAGKVNIWHLAQQQVNVTLVPVGSGSVGSAIADELNAIYNTAGVQFNVTIDTPFTINQSIWDVEKPNGQLNIGDSNTLANYTIEERAIYNHYKTQRTLQDQMYYIFVLGDDISTTDSATEGFMPLKRQYGFVFNPTNKSRTIAHELGHGIFGLEHPFTEYAITQGTTNLLMDYCDPLEQQQGLRCEDKIAFTHMDWQKIHAPGLQLYIFQGDEDGESTTENDYKTIENIVLNLMNHIKDSYNGGESSLEWEELVRGKCYNYNDCLITGSKEIVIDGETLNFRIKIAPSLPYETIKIEKDKETLKIRKNRFSWLVGVTDIVYRLNLESNGKLAFQFEFDHHDEIELFCKTLGINGETIQISEETKTYNQNEKDEANKDYDVKNQNELKNVISNDSSINEIILDEVVIIATKRTNVSKKIRSYLDEKLLPATITENTDCNDIDVYFAEAPTFHIKAKGEDLLWNALKSLLNCTIDEWGTNEEVAILSILKALGKTSSENLMKGLLDKLSNNSTILEVLWQRLDDYGGEDNFTALIKLLQNHWNDSSYSQTQYEIIPYNSTKVLGFYSSRYVLRWDGEIIDVFYNNNASSSDADYNPDTFNYSLATHIKDYNIYDPVILINYKNIDSDLNIKKTALLPMFMVQAMSTKNATVNLESSIILGVDVISTVSGIGNLGKLRHLKNLSKLQKQLKVTLATAEVTTGSLGIMVDLLKDEICPDESSNNNKTTCDKVRTFLTILELASLSADGLLTQVLKKSADDALAVIDDLPSSVSDVNKNAIKNDLQKLANAGDELADLARTFKGDIPNFYNSVKKAGHKVEKSGNIIKVYANSGTEVLAEISENSIRLKYKGWGSDVVTKSDRTTTCIAKFDDQLDAPGSQFIKNELPEGAFGRGTVNNGGVNILDVDEVIYGKLKDEARDILESSGKSFTNDDVIASANEIFWNRYNLPFLEEAFKRGDDVRLLSDPTTLFGSTGFYQREIEVITQGWTKADGTLVSPLKTKYNYKFNELTKTYEKIN